MENNKPEKHIVSASATIPARRERVYSLIANYNDGHPRILPRQFTSLVVEQGGVGAGTIIREPDPGRVLVETDLDANGAVTTFTVNRGAAPADSHVTISTELRMRSGVLGKIERTLSTLLLRPMYVQELENLARVATGPFAG
jgi:hypothetical protein